MNSQKGAVHRPKVMRFHLNTNLHRAVVNWLRVNSKLQQEYTQREPCRNPSLWCLKPHNTRIVSDIAGKSHVSYHKADARCPAKAEDGIHWWISPCKSQKVCYYPPESTYTGELSVLAAIFEKLHCLMLDIASLVLIRCWTVHELARTSLLSQHAY